jgi:aminodeoxyfutalosine deaminase
MRAAVPRFVARSTGCFSSLIAHRSSLIAHRSSLIAPNSRSRFPMLTPLQAWHDSWTHLRIDAAAIVDSHQHAWVPAHTQAAFRPVSILIEREPTTRRLRVLAIGQSADVDQHPAATRAITLNRTGCVLIPGMVNAHTHLDLTHIGPREIGEFPHFAAWLDMIRQSRHDDPEAITASVRQGVEKSLKAGVVLVGDIAGCVRGQPSALAGLALLGQPINAVSFIEFFSLNERWQSVVHAAVMQQALLSREATTHQQGGKVMAGISPHAPYSVMPEAFACLLDPSDPIGRLMHEAHVPIMMHVAESLSERQFIHNATGPIRELVEKLGLFTPVLAQRMGQGATPLQHVARAIDAKPGAAGERLIGVHLNDVQDVDLAQGCVMQHVAYCPRSSAYFQHHDHLGPHRYREIVEAGSLLALGTDSIVNLDTPDRMSVLDEGRALYRQARPISACTILDAMTRAGEIAITGGLGDHAVAEGGRAGSDEGSRRTLGFAFTPGSTPLGIVAIPVVGAAELGGGEGLDWKNTYEGGYSPKLAGRIADSVLVSAGEGELLAIGRV